MKTKLIRIIVFLHVLTLSPFAAAQQEEDSIYEILKQQNARFHRSGYDFSVIKATEGKRRLRLRAVNDKTYAPVADFAVTFLQGEEEEYTFNNEVVVSCPGGGICELDSLFPRPYTFHIAAAGFELKEIVVDVSNPGDDVVTVPLAAASGRIQGRVLDEESQQPLEGVVIRLLDDDVSVKTGRTNDRGFFALTGLRVFPEEKTYVLVYDSPDHFIKEIPFSFYKHNGDMQDVLLDFAPSVDGQLTDADARPLAGEQIFLLSKQFYEQWHDTLLWGKYCASSFCLTNQMGHFRFEKLQPGTYVLVYGGHERDISELEIGGHDRISVELKRTD